MTFGRFLFAPFVWSTPAQLDKIDSVPVEAAAMPIVFSNSLLVG
jgi:hypothetical protein